MKVRAMRPIAVAERNAEKARRFRIPICVMLRMLASVLLIPLMEVMPG